MTLEGSCFGFTIIHGDLTVHEMDDRCNRHPFFRKNLPLELQALMQDQGAAFAASTTQQPQQGLQDLMLVLSV